MSKFWALIAARRPHVFSLGKHENEEKAHEFAEAFCERKTREAAAEAAKIGEGHQGVTYFCMAVLDDSDMRTLTGEVHRPWQIAVEREVVAVETPKKLKGEPALIAAGEADEVVHEEHGNTWQG